MHDTTFVFLVLLLIFIVYFIAYFGTTMYRKLRAKRVELEPQSFALQPYAFDEEGSPDCRGLMRICWENSKQWEYYCKCGTRLSEGPEGGCSINAVCARCKINYGCLPGYYGDTPMN